MCRLLLFVAALLFYVNNSECRGVNGGIDCAACTIVMGLATQVAEVHEESVINGTLRLCGSLPKWIREYCFTFIEDIEPYIEDVQYLTPDLICLIYGSCTIDEGQDLCHLFPILPSKNSVMRYLEKARERNENLSSQKINVCDLPLIKNICDILSNTYTNVNATQDADGDGHSLISTARGADWRGRDCNDFDINVRPGRRPLNADKYSDSNCNGIYGLSDAGKAWEDILCANSERRGIIYVGDSVGAHFHMPQVWMNPIIFDYEIPDAVAIILDELDWPHLGFATGFMNSTTPFLIKGPTDSIYLRLRARNLCNHRDYQNVAKNGAASDLGVTFVNGVMRNQTEDYPVIAFYAMIGNDVCNNFAPNVTLSKMTTPVKFKANVMKTLKILDEKLPNNSQVVLVGLVNADFIYSAMANRVHPLGSLHKNIRYKDMYNWFNCLQIGPCTGWLNSNTTLRKLTSQRATVLSQVLKDITRAEKFKHFAVHYVENPINVVVRNTRLKIHRLLDAVDSFHPNQYAQPLIAKELWELLKALPEDVLGPINPNNEQIKGIFGNQGGH